MMFALFTISFMPVWQSSPLHLYLNVTNLRYNLRADNYIHFLWNKSMASIKPNQANLWSIHPTLLLICRSCLHHSRICNSAHCTYSDCPHPKMSINNQEVRFIIMLCFKLMPDIRLSTKLILLLFFAFFLALITVHTLQPEHTPLTESDWDPTVYGKANSRVHTHFNQQISMTFPWLSHDLAIISMTIQDL